MASFFPPLFSFFRSASTFCSTSTSSIKKNTKQTSSPVPPRDLHAQVQARRQDHGPLHGHADRRHQVRLVARPVRERKREKRARRREAREESKERFCLFVLLFSLSFSRSHSLSKNQNSKKKTVATPSSLPSAPARSSRVRGIEGERQRRRDMEKEHRFSLSSLSLCLAHFPCSSLSLSSLSFLSLPFTTNRLGCWPQLDVHRREAQAQDPLGHGLRCVFCSFLSCFFYKKERARESDERNEEKKKNSLSLSSFSLFSEHRRHGLPSQDPRRGHAHLRDRAAGDQREDGLKED